MSKLSYKRLIDLVLRVSPLRSGTLKGGENIDLMGYLSIERRMRPCMIIMLQLFSDLHIRMKAVPKSIRCTHLYFSLHRSCSMNTLSIYLPFSFIGILKFGL